MAQVLAVPGDVRHGFSYTVQFNHDFGRITGISATIKGNILLCDYDKKNLVLVDPLGDYLKKLDVDSEPYDVDITSQNIAFITLPNSRCVLQIDPDIMVVFSKITCNELSTTVQCVSALPNTGRDFSEISPCFLGVNEDGCFYVGAINYEHISSNIRSMSRYGFNIGSRVLKFHTVNKDSLLSCVGGQNYIRLTYISGHANTMNTFTEKETKIYNIATMDSPNDICSDDNGHIYISCHGSNNIHRLTQEMKMSTFYRRMELEYKVLDIPLDTHHGIKEPVALCFNKDCSKLFIVNEWGKSVFVFNVI